MKMNLSIYVCCMLILLVHSAFLPTVTGQNSGNQSADRQQQQNLLSSYKIFRGNTHAHTIYTWTHGAHREKSITDLSSPTGFHPDWKVPEGMDWKDYKSINMNPEKYSNRQGLPANHFALARENGYDFYVVSDHTQEPTLQPVSVSNPAWQDMIKAADQYDKYPDFVALAGFEYSRNTKTDGGNGHINVINSTEYVNADYGQRGPAPSWPEANWSIPLFYKWVKTAKPYQGTGSVAVGFNHPQPDQYNDWDNIDDEIAELISTFEIHSGYGEIRWEAYLRALNKGWKVSPIGVLDNHGLDDISKMPPPTLVLARELTRKEITEALRQRRTFVSWHPGVELKYAVNGAVMGSTIGMAEKYNFHIEIQTPGDNPKGRVSRIQILRNHPDGKDEAVVVDEQVYDGLTDNIVWEPVVENNNARYFLLRIHHLNDVSEDGKFKPHGSTLSAPVWIVN